MVRVLPRSARSKTRLRKLQRLFEHINEPAESRYLGWMTTFDEAARMALYSDAQLDLLASTVSDLPDPSASRPGRVAVHGIRSPPAVVILSRGPWSPIS